MQRVCQSAERGLYGTVQRVGRLTGGRGREGRVAGSGNASGPPRGAARCVWVVSPTGHCGGRLASFIASSAAAITALFWSSGRLFFVPARVLALWRFSAAFDRSP